MRSERSIIFTKKGNSTQMNYYHKKIVIPENYFEGSVWSLFKNMYYQKYVIFLIYNKILYLTTILEI